MDALTTKTKQLFPDISDDEAQEMVTAAKKASPGADEATLLSAIESVKDDDSKSSQARNYVQQKYQLGPQYSPEARQAIVDQNKEEASGLNWQAGLAALGAGMQGRDAFSAGQAVISNQQRARDAKLADFDKNRDLALAGEDKARSEEEKLARKDPNSDISKQMQQMAVEDYGMNPETAAKIPAEVLEARLPGLKYKAERADKAADLAFRRDEQGLRREEMAAQKAAVREDKLAKEAKPSEKMVQEFTEFDNALDSIKSIRGQKGNQDTGPLSTAQNTLAQFVGMDDADKSAFRSEVQDQLAQYIKSISGGSVSDSERASLLQTIPKMTDNDETFAAKLNTLEARLERNRANAMSNASKMGKNVDAFARDPNRKVVDGNFPKKVRKDGKEATVSNQSELDEALSEGWS